MYNLSKSITKDKAWRRAGVSPAILEDTVRYFAAPPGSFKTYTMRNSKPKSIKRPQVRSLKIDTKIKINRWSQTTIPMIRLSGVWLDKLGFNPEQRVTVTTMDKLLIIRLDENV